jgi:CubicO group peptidase (beta-lactamase class C family)
MSSMARPLFLLSLLTLLSAASAQDDAFQSILESHNLAGMSVVTRCGDALSIEAHVGQRDIGRDLPVNGNTTYRMASISKAVVALAAARLVQEGILDYDAPLGNYFDSPPVHPGHPDVPLTVHHLLTHTSGIRDGSGYGEFLSASYSSIPEVPQLGTVLEPGGDFYTANMWGTAAPGSWFQYANLNFGVLATVMEAATGVRFDQILEDHLFGPFGLDAGYRVQELDEINDLAVLYRQVDGQWTPQADHHEGVMPVGPDWSEYLPGINAVCFSPQGGLRISASDLTVLARLWSSGTAPSVDGLPLTLLNAESLTALHEEQWAYDASGAGNGNNYYGLFNSWGQGLHLAASGLGQDEIIPDVSVSPFVGHPGEAYGLISDAYATPGGEWNFVFATNGKWDGFTSGPASAYYAVEQDVFAVLRDDLIACLASSTTAADLPEVDVLGLHRAGDTTLRLGIPADWSGPVHVRLLDAGGREVHQQLAQPKHPGRLELPLSPLTSGWHVGVVEDERRNPLGRFLLVVGD